MVWMFTVGIALLILLYRFYRDPERTPPPNSADTVVSPADGVVIYIRESKDGKLPVSTKQTNKYELIELTKTSLEFTEALVVGIRMNLLDVHVTRTPIDGHIVSQRHYPGTFGSLRRSEMVFRNERATTVIERNGMQAAVVHIASRLVRQIAIFVHEGQSVAMGQRLGIIRFGSQVDLVLSRRNDLRVTAQVGQQVRAGESIVAVIEAQSLCR
jgi:phosphatidylserine decarboxylase